MFKIMAEIFDQSDCILGEGVLWDEVTKSLTWLDIYSFRMFQSDIYKINRSITPLPSFTGCVCLCKADGYLLTSSDGVVLYEGRTKKEVISIDGFSPVITRMNDGTVDPFGNLVFGTMDLNETEPFGRLYKLTPKRELHTILKDVVICNGPAFNIDGSWMYFSDSANGQVIRFPYGPSGILEDKGEIFYQSIESYEVPDGLTVDMNGNVWIAIWGGGSVLCLGENGKLRGRIMLPTPNVTSCVFGGENLDILFITTAKKGLDTAASLSNDAGSVFFAPTQVQGLPAFRFNLDTDTC